MIEIAKYAGINNEELFKSIMKDISVYSYPVMAIQSHRNKIVFIKYIISLAKLGLGKIYISIFLLLDIIFR